MWCSVHLRDQIFVKEYGFLLFAKNMDKNIGKNVSKNMKGKYSQKLFQKEQFKKQQKQLVI